MPPWDFDEGCFLERAKVSSLPADCYDESMIRVLAILIATTAVTACGKGIPPLAPEPAPFPGSVIESVLAQQVTPEFQSEVMILGTAHLSRFRDELRPEHLESLLALLESFAPTRIAVETLTANEVAILAERKGHDPAAAEVINLFARRILDSGRTMQQAWGIERVSAERRSLMLLDKGSLSLKQRRELIGYFLAAYEFDSALLQWSYLSHEDRAQAEALPADIRRSLDRALAQTSEMPWLALPLARRLGLQQIYPIDSQYDGVRTLSFPSESIEELFSDPMLYREGRDPDEESRVERVEKHSLASGDLLPLFLHLNSHEGQLRDVKQWNRLFGLRHSSGLDRFRYAMWEVRNLLAATNIIDAAASGMPERLLVIVGASHKSYLDRILATQLSVRLVHLSELEPLRRNEGATGSN